MRRAFYWLDAAVFLALAVRLFTIRVWTASDVAGFVFACGGFFLWTLARVQLGASFRARPRASRLVTHGLYARFRHPVYLFSELAFLGLALVWGAWPGFLCVALVGAIQWWRVRQEESVLDRAFGAQYREYRARTWL